MDSKVFGREAFYSSSRLGIDEAHYGPSTIDCAFFSLGLWYLLWEARTGSYVVYVRS